MTLYGNDSREFAYEMFRPSLESIRYWWIQNKKIEDEVVMFEAESGGFVVQCKDLDLSFLDGLHCTNEGRS